MGECKDVNHRSETLGIDLGVNIRMGVTQHDASPPLPKDNHKLRCR